MTIKLLRYKPAHDAVDVFEATEILYTDFEHRHITFSGPAGIQLLAWGSRDTLLIEY